MYTVCMHAIQEQLLNLIDSQQIGSLTLREIGELIGEQFPQKIKHHLDQLEKKSLIVIDKRNNSIKKTHGGKISGTSLVSIPILGTANCGPATFYADSNTDGYLKLSSSLLKKKKDIYVVKADGISMNRAVIGGNTIEDGDYLVVDSTYSTPEDNDIVVSVFDGMANVKRFRSDPDNNRVVLLSESSRDFPPIIIHEDDDFQVAGKVVQVIKKPVF